MSQDASVTIIGQSKDKKRALVRFNGRTLSFVIADCFAILPEDLSGLTVYVSDTEDPNVYKVRDYPNCEPLGQPERGWCEGLPLITPQEQAQLESSALP
jgi:hypothetical protein